MDLGTVVGHNDAGGVSSAGSLQSVLPAFPISSGHSCYAVLIVSLRVAPSIIYVQKGVFSIPKTSCHSLKLRDNPSLVFTSWL